MFDTLVLAGSDIDASYDPKELHSSSDRLVSLYSSGDWVVGPLGGAGGIGFRDKHDNLRSYEHPSQRVEDREYIEQKHVAGVGHFMDFGRGDRVWMSRELAVEQYADLTGIDPYGDHTHPNGYWMKSYMGLRLKFDLASGPWVPRGF